MEYHTYKEIIGLTIESVKSSADEIIFYFSNGDSCKFYHRQECCETVEVEDVAGDFQDLIGSPLLVAEERVNRDDNPHGFQTWTFYTFRTNKGSVDIRWLGESNGYYSESVDFTFTKGEKTKEKERMAKVYGWDK